MTPQEKLKEWKRATDRWYAIEPGILNIKVTNPQEKVEIHKFCIEMIECFSRDITKIDMTEETFRELDRLLTISEQSITMETLKKGSHK